ncbi:MAG: hypothetical protein QMB51_00800 [Patescibacteria group bacterium]
MIIESSNISDIPVKILYIEDVCIYEEIERKNNQKKCNINYSPTTKLVFGLDFAVDFFKNNKESLLELENYYYYGQINSRKAIILAEL